MSRMIKFINVRLPERPTCLYELTAIDGIWKQKIKQEDMQIPFIDSHVEIVDCFGKVVLPGLVDAHMHLDKAFSLHTVGNESGTLSEAIRNYSAAYPRFTVEELKQRIRRTALLALSQGTTHLRSHLDFHPGYGKKLAFHTIQAGLEVREELKEFIDMQFIIMSPSIGATDEVWGWMHEALLMGIDGVGGAPHVAPDSIAHTNRIFKLAMRHSKTIDLHVDESDDPNKNTASYLAEKTIEEGYEGFVTAGHLCSLSAMTETDAWLTIEKLKKAEINVITLPGSNFYLQGREDKGIVRRGVTRIKELLQADITVATASDNIQDAFHPWGNADLLQVGMLTAYASHLGTDEHLSSLFSMITNVPASMLGIDKYGIKIGHPATCVVTSASNLRELLIGQARDRRVYREGVLVAKDGKITLPHIEIAT